jgi:2-amino-4-hydroxy-6-hydroxymethyldihydropteridine diphosphokinase
MHNSYLSIGGNIGDRLSYIIKAKDYIKAEIGEITLESKIYETEPWGFSDQQYFLNMVAKVITDLNCYCLLDKIHEIEQKLGRERTKNNYSSRTIDIDILFYDDIIVNETDLIIPHPYLHKRRFTLIPLNEINQDLIHPVLNQTIKNLLSECKDHSEVRIF